MFVHYYKGYYISGQCDGLECDVIYPHGGLVVDYTFKSYRAAQLFITKLIKLQSFTGA